MEYFAEKMLIPKSRVGLENHLSSRNLWMGV
ncbi:MAG: hypothetical protein METHSR3v1_1040010 [Methanothrix sp.]|nr:MAG: hypothetical protein METHSR3v1_1040010 [Methanothrix sp.]